MYQVISKKDNTVLATAKSFIEAAQKAVQFKGNNDVPDIRWIPA